MAKSRETWNKKEKETNKKKKKDQKEQRKLVKKTQAKEKGKRSFEDMIAYVDENGVITSQAPDPTKKKQVIDADSIEISVSRKTDEEEVEEMLTGVVAFFNTSKGYGFIKDPANGKSYFVHIHDLITPITENDRVTFKAEAGQRGMKAVQVKVAVATPPAANTATSAE